MALLTDQQMKMALYAGAAILAFNWLRAQSNGNSMRKQAAQDIAETTIEVAKGLGEVIGTEIVKPVAKVAAEAAKKPIKAIYSGMEIQFLQSVEGMGDIHLGGDTEKKIALAYMPNGVVSTLDGLPIFSQWAGAKAYLGAKAVKEFRNVAGARLF